MAFKFNNGRGAIICDYCRIIIKEPATHSDHNLAGDKCISPIECAKRQHKNRDIDDDNEA